MKHFRFLMLVVFASTLPVAAQTGPADLGPTVSKKSPIALSINYTAMVGNSPPGSCGCFLLNGGSSEEVIHVWKNVSAVAQVAGSRSGQVPGSIQGLSIVTYMAGPRYSHLMMHRLTVYGQFLAGGVHGFDTYIPRDDAKSTGGASSYAFAPGAGVEVGLRSWLSVRAVEAEYLSTHLPNAVNSQQNNLRISSGIVFRFSAGRLNR